MKKFYEIKFDTKKDFRKFASIKEAEKIIRETKEKELTSYYGQTFSTSLPQYLSFAGMKETFKDKGFGEAETNFILACMVKAGCKFTI